MEKYKKQESVQGRGAMMWGHIGKLYNVSPLYHESECNNFEKIKITKKTKKIKKIAKKFAYVKKKQYLCIQKNKKNQQNCLTY